MEGSESSPPSTPAKLAVPVTKVIPHWFSLSFGSFSLMGILLNGLCVMIFCRRASLRKRKSNLFILSLACADLAVGVCSLIYLLCLLLTRLDDFTKKVSTIVQGFSLETSMFSLCCLTYERLVAVRTPLKYNVLVTSINVNSAILFSWILAAGLSIAQGLFAFLFKDGGYFKMSGVVLVVLATATSVFLSSVYAYLYHEIRRHSTHIRSMSISVACSMDLAEIPTRSADDTIDTLDDTDGNLDITHESMFQKSHPHRQVIMSQRRERKSLILCALIVFSFCICWTPVTIFFVGELSNVESLTEDYILFASNCFVAFNSLIDPCVYFAVRTELRRAAFSMIKPCTT